MNSVTSTSSSFRVSCGELVVDDLWSVHHEVELGVVRSGSITIETAIGVEQLNKGDIFFIAPNQKHRFDNNNNVYIEIMLLNLNDGANLTQQFIPNAIIKSIVGGNCTKFFSFKPGRITTIMFPNVLNLLLVQRLTSREDFIFWQQVNFMNFTIICLSQES